MIQAFIAKWIAKLGKNVVMIGGAIASLAFLFLGHKYKVSKAEKTGKKEGIEKEQERVILETHKKTIEIKEKANEIKETVDRGNADLDDLRRRMRESATANSSDK